MRSLGEEFKDFILRGNVVSLAVAVIIGAAFTNIVTALTDHIIMPIIAAFGGQPDFSAIGFHINNSYFGVGSLINAVINFLIVAAIVFFVVVKPMNALLDRNKATEDPTTTECPYCLSEVPIAASRCAHCTSELSSASV